jgi:hypothetical protein
MGLPQHTHEMTWRSAAIVGFDAMFFCKIVARWVYLNTRIELITAMRCARMVWWFVVCKILARWVYKKHQSSETRPRPRNPRIPIVRFDIQTAFRARMNIFKSGISWSDSPLNLDELSEMAIRPNLGASCRRLKHTHAMKAMRCFVFCKIVARWAYKNTHMRTLPRCAAFDWFDAL